MVDPAPSLFCPHARPAGDYCPHCPPARPSALVVARGIVIEAEALEAAARREYREAEEARGSSDLPEELALEVVGVRRRIFQYRSRQAFEAREQLRKAEVAEAEEARRR